MYCQVIPISPDNIYHHSYIFFIWRKILRTSFSSFWICSTALTGVATLWLHPRTYFTTGSMCRLTYFAPAPPPACLLWTCSAFRPSELVSIHLYIRCGLFSLTSESWEVQDKGASRYLVRTLFLAYVWQAALPPCCVFVLSFPSLPCWCLHVAKLTKS